MVYHRGLDGETYNIGGFNEWQNIDLVKTLCALMDKKLGRTSGTSEKLITFVKDRPGHDLRYAIDANKIRTHLGFEPSVNFEEGLEKTVDWYLANEEWLEHVTSGSYKNYYKTQYTS
jgi:dTDP-glucose 4,6-dehydratase